MQVPAEQVMAIGDHDSDAALLQWAGIGVAMGNATPAAKAAADVITSSNLRDGVAEALEQWVLGRGTAGRGAGACPRSPNPVAGSGAPTGSTRGSRPGRPRRAPRRRAASPLRTLSW